MRSLWGLLFLAGCTRANPLCVTADCNAAASDLESQPAPPDLGGPDLESQPAPPDLGRRPDLAHSAAVEDCFNGSDDDGDGVVNNGCPASLGLGATVALAEQGSESGNHYSAVCPAGQVVVGLTVYLIAPTGTLAGMDVYCSTPVLQQEAAGYSVTLARPTVPSAGLFSDGHITVSHDSFCPTGSFDAAWSTTLSLKPSAMSGLEYDCAVATPSLSADNQLSFTFTGTGDDLGLQSGGTRGTPESCGAAQALVGYYGWVDDSGLQALQPICAPVVVNYQ